MAKSVGKFTLPRIVFGQPYLGKSEIMYVLHETQIRKGNKTFGIFTYGGAEAGKRSDRGPMHDDIRKHRGETTWSCLRLHLIQFIWTIENARTMCHISHLKFVVTITYGYETHALHMHFHKFIHHQSGGVGRGRYITNRLCRYICLPPPTCLVKGTRSWLMYMVPKGVDGTARNNALAWMHFHTRLPESLKDLPYMQLVLLQCP